LLEEPPEELDLPSKPPLEELDSDDPPPGTPVSSPGEVSVAEATDELSKPRFIIPRSSSRRFSSRLASIATSSALTGRVCSKIQEAAATKARHLLGYMMKGSGDTRRLELDQLSVQSEAELS